MQRTAQRGCALDLLERDLVASLQRLRFPCRGLLVNLDQEREALRVLIELLGNAVIVEVFDRDQLAEPGDAAVMIGVPVADDEMVDGLEAGVGAGLVNALGVAGAGIAAINQHRFTGGRDHQRGRAALRCR